jgi:hypothetical protein
MLDRSAYKPSPDALNPKTLLQEEMQVAASPAKADGLR